MKRIISILLALSALYGPLSAQTPIDYNDKGRYKEVSFAVPNAEGQMLSYLILPEGDNTVALVRPDKKKDRYNDASYTIPATVSYNGQTYTVTEIGTDAFSSSKASRVNLPATVKYIASYAFGGSDLTEIVLPQQLKAIGKFSFYSCKKLTSVTFNEGLETIDKSAFYFCLSLSSAILPSTLKTIEEGAFAYTRDMQELSIPKEIQKIDKLTFNRDYTIAYTKYNGLISSLPDWITPSNCKPYGLSPDAVEHYLSNRQAQAQPAQQPQVIYVQQPVAQTVPAATPVRPAPSSDVDQNIPEAPTSNANTFAIIIANENYQKEVPVQYALNDGETFKNYCLKTLGLPEDNIHYIADATLNNMLAEVDWIAKVAKAYNGEASLIVYYAGHGIPDEASGSSYLLPVDGIGNNLRTGYSLAELYKTLGALPAKSVTVFMDACFSGAKRGEGMLASARGVAIKAKPEAPKGNMVVFSAAQGDETAYPYEDKGHGLFTYFLLKKLQETKGQVSLGELAQYVQQQVSRRSIVTNRKSQTPCVTPSESMVNTWKNKTLK